jgi:cis-zeatin O-glucosyltransferase
VKLSFSDCESYAFHCVPAFYQLCMILDNHRDMETLLLGDSEDSKLRHLILTPFNGCFSDELREFISSLDFETPVGAGVVINSSREFDGEFVSLLARHESYCGKKIFVVGPVNRLPINPSQRHECLDWLDKQPPASVVYVAFGSTVTLPEEQIMQLAEGLKLSGQRFIRVLRDADRGDIYADEVKNSSPEKKTTMVEFEEEMGMVVTDWVPQLEILGHRSTAAFVSHCGWNSCIESLRMGVPIIAWPMHSDQPRNALFLTENLKVGVLLREWDQRAEIVSSERIAEVIRAVMAEEEGKEIRMRAQRLGEAIRAGMEDGGDSRNDIESFIQHITRA